MCNLSGLLSDRGEHSESVSLAKRACELVPHDPLNWNNLATSYVAAGDIPSAVAALRQALKLDPNMIEPHANLMLLLEKTDSLAALAHAMELVRIAPRFEKEAEGNLIALIPLVRDGNDAHLFARALRLKESETIEEKDVRAMIDEWAKLPSDNGASRDLILKAATGHLLRTMAESLGMKVAIGDWTKDSN
jgi:Flp pilus assembly protein TadD